MPPDTFGIQVQHIGLLRVATTDNNDNDSRDNDTFLCDSCAILIPLPLSPHNSPSVKDIAKYSNVTLDAAMSIAVKLLFL